MRQFNLKHGCRLCTNQEPDWQVHLIVIVAINLLLAFASLLKDVVVAAYLGTSAQADAFILSYFIVDTVGNNLWAAALGVAILPVFSEIRIKKGNAEANRVISRISFFSFFMGVILISGFYFSRHWLIANLGQGLAAPIQELTVLLLIILLPALVCYPLINIGISVLQVKRKFALSAFSPVVFNCILLGGAVWVYHRHYIPNEGVVVLSAFITLGVLVQLFFTWLFVGKDDMIEHPKPGNSITGNSTKEIIKNFIPYFIVLLSVQMTYGVERYLASGLGSGTLAALNYSFRIVQFPVWVFIAAISAVAFPTLSRKLLVEGEADFAQSVGQFIYTGLFCTLPLTIVLLVLRTPIISILFERGSFSFESTRMTASIMTGYTLTIAWQGFSALLVRVCLLYENKYLPILAAMASMGINICLDFVFVRYLGAKGLGFAAAIGTFVNFIILFIFLDRNHRLFRGGFEKLPPLLGSNTALFLTLLCWLEGWKSVQYTSLWGKWGYLCLIGVTSTLIYGGSYILFQKIQTNCKKIIP